MRGCFEKARAPEYLPLPKVCLSQGSKGEQYKYPSFPDAS